MTVTVGHFFCKTCKLTFEGEYKPQQRPRKSCPKCHNMVGMAVTKKKKKAQVPPRIEKDFIDDPVELLTSVCKRSLNKADPDSRWASILLTLLDKTNKLEYKDIEEAQLQNQLKAKSISELISSKKKLIKL